MDNINQNLTPRSGGLSNVLSGVGIVILGLPLAFFIFGPALISDFGPGETWVKRAIIVTIIAIIVYGLLGYILGKIKPSMSWKSGFLLSLVLISGAVFLLLWILTSLGSGNASIASINLTALLLLFPITIAVVVSSLSSYFGSHSKSTWQGKSTSLILTIIILMALFFVGYFLVRGFFARQNMNTLPMYPSVDSQ